MIKEKANLSFPQRRESRKTVNWIPAYAGMTALLMASSPTFAAPNNGISNKYQSDKPIEITSDALEVLQKQNKAIFTGHVVAVQGDVHLKSEKMTVFYKNSEGTKTKKKSADKSVVPEQQSIDKIIVEKKVFLSTPEETASGTDGIYDVAKQKIFLNGNVVLTRENNVLKGNKLVYDFATGKSEMKANNVAGKPKDRVKALFIPKNEEKK